MHRRRVSWSAHSREAGGRRLCLQGKAADRENKRLRHGGLGPVPEIRQEIAIIGYRQAAAIDVSRRIAIGNEHVIGAGASLDIQVLAQFQGALGADGEQAAVAPGRQAVRGEPVDAGIASGRRGLQHELGEILEPVRFGAERADRAVGDVGVVRVREGQELVGLETASALRDFLKTGVIRNAVNFPSVAPEEFQRLQPFMKLGKQLGCLVGQMGEARIESLGVRYYGDLASGQHPLIVNAVLVGLFEAILSETVTEVNARAVAAARGIDLIESSSTRARDYRSLLSVKMMTSDGERWVEGTVAANHSRLILLNGVPIEAPLNGTLLLLANNDQPGVIGEVGTILGKHGINIANFALGRNGTGAVGAVNVDEPGEQIGEDVLKAIRGVQPVKAAWLVRV